MKIAIVTQPLLNNYGGVLQNFAMQTFLKKMGYSPITIDFLPPPYSLFRCLSHFFKSLLLRILGKKRSFWLQRNPFRRKLFFSDFVNGYIHKTEVVHEYKSIYCCDAVIVGSDQVWRPLYNEKNLKDMFLNFCEKKTPLKRIAYAASFGVDEWEYNFKQTQMCSKLALKFNAISVREESGVKLCKDNFGVNASWVLDPTLLLDKEDYCNLCKNVLVKKNVLMAYVLNMNSSIQTMCETIAKERGLSVVFLGSDSDATLSIPEWLAMFRDASYVVTDSFHGTVFSIIFEKEFKCLYNKGRGNSRFESLLNLYNSGKMEEKREFSKKWLKNSLEN